jgi:hypothetical protein
MKMAAGPGGAVANSPGVGTGANGNPGTVIDDASIAAEAARRCDKWFAWPPWESQEQKKAKCIAEETAKIKKDLQEAIKRGMIPTGLPSEFKLENVFPTPEAWIAETNKILDESKIPEHAFNLGMALLFAGFVYSLVSLMRAHASDQLFLLFGRLIIAAGLILASAPIRAGNQWIWQGAYDVMKANIVKPATTALQTDMDELYPLLTSLVSIAVAGEFIAGLSSAGNSIPIIGGGFQVIGNVSTTAAKIAAQSARGLLTVMIMLAGLYAVYFFAIYASGMIMILVGLLVPILMAFLVIPGMASWFTRWFSMAFTSLLMVIAFPILFSVVVTLGVNKPMDSVQRQLEPIQQTAKEFVQIMNTAPELKLDPGTIASMAGWVAQALAKTVTIAWRLIFIAVPLTISIILLVISIVACMYLLQQLPGILSGFTGSHAPTSASLNSAAFTAGFAAAAGLAASSLGDTTSKGVIGAGKVGVAAGGAAVGGIRNGYAALHDKFSSRNSGAPEETPTTSTTSRPALPAAGGSSGGGVTGEAGVVKDNSSQSEKDKAIEVKAVTVK